MGSTIPDRRVVGMEGKVLVCDFCKREYTEHGDNESPLDICDKFDCEAVSKALEINTNIQDL